MRRLKLSYLPLIVQIYTVLLYGVILNKVSSVVYVCPTTMFLELFSSYVGVVVFPQEFVLRNIPNFDVIRRKLVYSLLSRVSSSTNVLITAILDMIHFTESEMFKSWKNILF